MEKIPTSQLLKELQEINPNVELVPNPNLAGVGNFKLFGEDIGTAVPIDYLQTEHSPKYIQVFKNGWEAPHKTYAESKGQCEAILLKLKDEDFNKEFFLRDEKE